MGLVKSKCEGYEACKVERSHFAKGIKCYVKERPIVDKAYVKRLVF